MTESDIPGLLALLNGHKRVWLVYGYAQDTDPGGLVPQTLASVMKLSYERDYGLVKIQFYQGQ